MLAIRLPSEIEDRLEALAQATGRTKTFYPPRRKTPSNRVGRNGPKATPPLLLGDIRRDRC